MDSALNVLLVEDSADDAELILRQLRRGGYEPRWRRVDTAAALQAALTESVSHDLQAPLRAIRGFSDSLLAASGQLDSSMRSDVGRIHTAAGRLQQLIDALLELGRVTHCELHHASVDLSRMAHAVAAELQRAAPDRRCTFAIADGLRADGDPRLLQVVVANLLDNAWKYTARRAHAHIAVGAEERRGERVYFVRDDGVGFDPADADLLFAPFRRLHGAEFAGTGIGLSTVARIIHRHGGHIWAEGQPDRGASFYFTLGSAAAAA